jgi:transcriptional regulator with XRE-family HTH domain
MGQAIRTLRMRRGLGQREAAAIRGHFDQSRWSKVERGVQSPTLEVLDSFLEALQATPVELMDALLDEDASPDDICAQVLVAYRLGGLSPSETEVITQLIKSHRESLLQVVSEFRRKNDSSLS